MRRFITCTSLLAALLAGLTPLSAGAQDRTPRSELEDARDDRFRPETLQRDITHDDGTGRWVDFGPWNGVVDCEASPTAHYPPLSSHPEEVRADIRNVSSGAAGLFQFMPSTWRWVANSRGELTLAQRPPTAVTIAQQFRQAEWLRTNWGIYHWVCGFRYGDGTGARYVTAEAKPPRDPAQCRKNLRRQWGANRSMRVTMCGGAR